MSRASRSATMRLLASTASEILGQGHHVAAAARKAARTGSRDHEMCIYRLLDRLPQDDLKAFLARWEVVTTAAVADLAEADRLFAEGFDLASAETAAGLVAAVAKGAVGAAIVQKYASDFTLAGPPSSRRVH